MEESTTTASFRKRPASSEILPLVNCRSAALCGVLSRTAFAERNPPSVQTVSSKLVFRFNWGGPPVTAKY